MVKNIVPPTLLRESNWSDVELEKPWPCTHALNWRGCPDFRSFESQGYGGKGKYGCCALHGLSRCKAVGRCLALPFHRLHHQAKVVPRYVICRLKPENIFFSSKTRTWISLIWIQTLWLPWEPVHPDVDYQASSGAGQATEGWLSASGRSRASSAGRSSPPPTLLETGG